MHVILLGLFNIFYYVSFQVDTHNIVPCWITSPKQEYGARTIRSKIHSQLCNFLTDFPPVIVHPYKAKEIVVVSSMTSLNQYNNISVNFFFPLLIIAYLLYYLSSLLLPREQHYYCHYLKYHFVSVIAHKYVGCILQTLLSLSK